ncbi:MAG TPA: hypothetical protein PLP19_19895 [bacterium]|nr:hypothetical protein [bacterium]HPN45758.1 hypothetical protein [bacterium]
MAREGQAFPVFPHQGTTPARSEFLYSRLVPQVDHTELPPGRRPDLLNSYNRSNRVSQPGSYNDMGFPIPCIYDALNEPAQPCFITRVRNPGPFPAPGWESRRDQGYKMGRHAGLPILNS